MLGCYRKGMFYLASVTNMYLLTGFSEWRPLSTRPLRTPVRPLHRLLRAEELLHAQTSHRREIH